MKVIKKVGKLLFIFSCILIITACSSEPKEVKESRRRIEGYFNELKEGNILGASKLIDTTSEEDDILGYHAEILMFDKIFENADEVLKDFLKDAELKYEGFEYYKDDDSYDLYYTYKGKDLEHFITAVTQQKFNDILDGPLTDILGDIVGSSSNPFEDELVDVFGIDTSTSIDGKVLSPIIREAGKAYIDMNRVNFRNLEDIEEPRTYLVYVDENGNIQIR